MCVFFVRLVVRALCTYGCKQNFADFYLPRAPVNPPFPHPSLCVLFFSSYPQFSLKHKWRLFETSARLNLAQRTSYRFSSLYYKAVKLNELNAWINKRWLKVYLLLFFLQSTPNIYALLTRPVQSRWLDIGQFVSAFIDQDYVEVNKNSKKNETNIQPSWKKRFGQQTTYYMAKKRTFSCGIKAGNPERPILPARVANQDFHLVRSWIQPYNNNYYYYPLVSPTHLSRQQAGGSTRNLSERPERPWGVERSP